MGINEARGGKVPAPRPIRAQVAHKTNAAADLRFRLLPKSALPPIGRLDDRSWVISASNDCHRGIWRKAGIGRPEPLNGRRPRSAMRYIADVSGPNRRLYELLRSSAVAPWPALDDPKEPVAVFWSTDRSAWNKTLAEPIEQTEFGDSSPSRVATATATTSCLNARIRASRTRVHDPKQK